MLLLFILGTSASIVALSVSVDVWSQYRNEKRPQVAVEHIQKPPRQVVSSITVLLTKALLGGAKNLAHDIKADVFELIDDMIAFAKDIAPVHHAGTHRRISC